MAAQPSIPINVSKKINERYRKIVDDNAKATANDNLKVLDISAINPADGTNISTVQFLYDSQGNRIKKHADRQFVVFGGSGPIDSLRQFPVVGNNLRAFELVLTSLIQEGSLSMENASAMFQYLQQLGLNPQYVTKAEKAAKKSPKKKSSKGSKGTKKSKKSEPKAPKSKEPVKLNERQRKALADLQKGMNMINRNEHLHRLSSGNSAPIAAPSTPIGGYAPQLPGAPSRLPPISRLSPARSTMAQPVFQAPSRSSPSPRSPVASPRSLTNGRRSPLTSLPSPSAYSMGATPTMPFYR